MNAGQYEGLMARLGEILDRMPERKAPAASEPQAADEPGYDPGPTVLGPHGWPVPVQEPPFPGPATSERGALVSSVLYALLVNLDGWVDGAHSNHEASDHRGENTGSECWREFAPSDIRNMINDVAREFGVSEFPRPEVPKEDTYR